MKRKRILIVDDEPSITFGLSRCLQSENVDVVGCNDSDSAWKALTSSPFDAVIADVNLNPGDSNPPASFIQNVRLLSCEVPLIMMSALDELKNEAYQCGANHFFEKPLDVAQLIHLLRGLGLEVGG